MRSTDRNSFQRDAERKFPIKIDIPVPPSGLGRRLTDMLDWCHANVAAGAWAQHGTRCVGRASAPRTFARWYFLSDADAVAFRRRWVLLTMP